MRGQVPALRKSLGGDEHVRVCTGWPHRRVVQADQRNSTRFGDTRSAMLAEGPGDNEIRGRTDPQRVGIEQRSIVMHDLAQGLGQRPGITCRQPALPVRRFEELLRVRTQRIGCETGPFAEINQVG